MARNRGGPGRTVRVWCDLAGGVRAVRLSGSGSHLHKHPGQLQPRLSGVSGRETDSDVAYQSRLYGICETASSGQLGPKQLQHPGCCSPSAKPTLVGRRRRRRLPLRSLRSGWVSTDDLGVMSRDGRRDLQVRHAFVGRHHARNLSNCATTTTFRGSRYGATTASACSQRGATFPTPSRRLAPLPVRGPAPGRACAPVFAPLQPGRRPCRAQSNQPPDAREGVRRGWGGRHHARNFREPTSNRPTPLMRTPAFRFFRFALTMRVTLSSDPSASTETDSARSKMIEAVSFSPLSQ